jgi:hypothetical protein
MTFHSRFRSQKGGVVAIGVVLIQERRQGSRPGRRLSRLAYQLADEARVRADYYKEQLRLLQARQAEIQTSLAAAKLSRRRLAKFQAEVNGNFQCPRCWINQAMRSSLDPVPGMSGGVIFRCNECDFEISTSG